MVILLYFDAANKLQVKSYKDASTCLAACNRMIQTYRGVPYLLVVDEQVVITYNYFAKIYKKDSIRQKIKELVNG